MVLAEHPTIDVDAYVALVLANPDRRLELVDGHVREKPGMSMDHNLGQSRLLRPLYRQLDERVFDIRPNSARLRTPGGQVYIPDIAVVPMALVVALAGRDRALETYDAPVPFVAEVWSPSTGDYDVETKFAGYRDRRDQEIWRVHPFEKTVVAWRLQPDGTYITSPHTGGSLGLWALPNLTIDLDLLLE